MRLVVSVLDNGTGPNLRGADLLDQNWLDNIRQRDMLEIRNASNTKLVVFGTFPLHLCMGESRTLVTLDVVEKLAVPVLFGTTFIDKFIKSIHADERKINLHHSAPVPILMPHEFNCEAKRNSSDTHQFIAQYPALLVMPISSESKYITAARQVALKAIYETPVLVSTNAVAPVEEIPHEKVAESHACMMAKEIMDV